MPVNPPFRLAWFIEPKGAFLDFIVAAKDQFRLSWPQAQYLCHPPHSTVLFGTFKDSEESRGAAAIALSKCDSFAMALTEPLVFVNDVPAGGGQTLAVGVALPNDALFKLQMALAKAMKPYLIREEIQPAFADPAWTKSAGEYGFPFVGSHWKPHFTVASLPIEPNDPLVHSWRSRVICQSQAVSSVSLWQVEGDKHERLIEFPLSHAF